MIKRAEAGDIAVIAQMALKMWPGHTLEELEEVFDQTLQEQGSAVFLYIAGTCAVGFAQCGLRHDYVEGTDSSPVAYLEGIYVEEEHRHNGYAAALLSACEAWGREMGCSQFASDCQLDNDASLAFHLKMGFTEANRIICFTKDL